VPSSGAWLRPSSSLFCLHPFVMQPRAVLLMLASKRAQT
jgi:hypothetical protein